MSRKKRILLSALITFVVLAVLFLAVWLRLSQVNGLKDASSQLNEEIRSSRLASEERTEESSVKSGVQPDEEEDDPAPTGAFGKLQAGQPVNVLVLGDSIGAGYAASPEKGWIDSAMQSLADEYGSSIRCDNLSQVGTTAYFGYETLMQQNDSVAYDWVIVCFGENDSTEDFDLYYEVLLRAIKTKYPDCILLCTLESSQREYTEKIKTIQELCDYYGGTAVDAIEAFDKSNKQYDDLAPDEIHPNDDGYFLYAAALLELMKTETEPIDPEAALPEPRHTDARLFAKYEYRALEEMELRDGVYRIEHTGPVAVLHYTASPNGGDYSIDLDWEPTYSGTTAADLSEDLPRYRILSLSMPEAYLLELQLSDSAEILGISFSSPEE